MRRIALPSDVHGNTEAFSAVLADVCAAAPDDVFCLGDPVGWRPRRRRSSPPVFPPRSPSR